MEISNKRCPRCGSLNVVKILYGMPTYEAFVMAGEGKIKLGGCCITESDPEYFCKDCKNEWDRQTLTANAYNEIDGIKASVGGYFGDSYEMDIDFSSRKLKWRNSGAGVEDHYEKIIKQNTLDRFIEELKKLKVLNWKAKYIQSDVCDGTQWSLEIRKSGKNILLHGDNKFPDEWDRFCTLISRISGKKFR